MTKIELDKLAEIGKRYTVRRLVPESRYLDELKALIGLKGRDWTDPFGRAYQYEFFIQADSRHELSLLVEISAVAKAAIVYFGYRDYVDRDFTDECKDDPRDPNDMALRERVVNFLGSKGYAIIPYELVQTKYGEKTLWELLICDTED